jgi:hypothetical protein
MVDKSPNKGRRSINQEHIGILDLLPIEILQKDAVISDIEVNEHPVLILKVIYFYNYKLGRIR